jgi:hypothetical protein
VATGTTQSEGEVMNGTFDAEAVPYDGGVTLKTLAADDVEPRPAATELQGPGVFAGVAADPVVGRALVAGTATAPAPATAELAGPLLSSEESKGLRARWDAVQVGFVDEPRQAVEQADALVTGALARLAEIFAEECTRIVGQWDRGDDVSTEDLRLALKRYRSFFGRLLSV